MVTFGKLMIVLLCIAILLWGVCLRAKLNQVSSHVDELIRRVNVLEHPLPKGE